ncbi:MAG: uracil-DNA glycosylase, partial [Chitinophagaceae bacterium]|nr:uracil-DNA glycosylase [Chitinophagaceae bacterium]
VILGQDPYHGVGQAMGLSFSVPDGVAPPPSLVNIFKELKNDIGMPIPKTGNLMPWANQGVLLLNSILTVRANEAASHSKIGWMNFTDAVIKKISDEKKGIVFLLWGRFAQEKQVLIDATKHYILKAAHPSPLSAHNGFWGCKHFSRTNEILIQQGIQPIDWKLSSLQHE